MCFVSRKKTVKPRFWLLMMAVLAMVFGGVYISQGQYLNTQAQHISALEGARTLLAAYARGWRRVPVLELFLFCPVYTWLLIGAGLSLGRRRRWGELLAFGGAALSFGVCLLSPVNDYFRYFLPIVAMCPPLLAVAAAPPRVPDRSASPESPRG